MANYGNAFFSGDTVNYAGGNMPVWIEVKERKLAGGVVDLSGVAKGTLIPLGIPAVLKSMGGKATLLDTFEVQEAVAADGTSLKIKPVNGAVVPAEGLILGKADASTGVAAKAAKLTGNPVVEDGVYTFTITAGAFGELSKGDILYIFDEEGSDVKAALPVGLTWRQIYVDAASATHGTVAIVTKGQILGDRIAAVPEFYKAAMPGITFEYENE